MTMRNNDLAAERAVLAGVCRYGAEGYHEVADLVNESTFSIDSNQIIWSCFKKLIEHDERQKIDIPSVCSCATELGIGYIFEKKQEIQHLQSIFNFPVDISNVRKFAAKLRKLQLAKDYADSLTVARDKLYEVTGEEAVSDILSIGEKAIFDFGNTITNTNDGPVSLGSDIDELIAKLEAEPVEQMGISTGYSKFDFAIGGGLRDATVNVIGARPKTGKTLLSDNIGSHIAGNVLLPVLNLDTEMIRKDHQIRTLAMLSEVAINDIETGRYSKQPNKRHVVRAAASRIKNMTYDHQSIGGLGIDEILGYTRRWISKRVGFRADGRANPCVIIYDYLKLTSSAGLGNNLSEFQALGFMMTKLHDFGVKYEIPILAFVQLNRDGINKEDTDSISQSDRIAWLCSNFTIYKKKSDEEIAEDGPEHGARKLVPVMARHGQGLESGEYINMIFKGYCGKIIEGKTNLEIQSNVSSTQKNEVFVVNDDDDKETIQNEIFGPGEA
jgi:replicative DNA helicase